MQCDVNTLTHAYHMIIIKRLWFLLMEFTNPVGAILGPAHCGREKY